MKKIILHLPIVMVFLLSACQSNDYELAEVKEILPITFGTTLEEVSYLGDSHNQMLTEAELFYSTCEAPPSDYSAEMRGIREWQYDCINFLPLSQEEKIELQNEMHNHTTITPPEQTLSDLFPNNQTVVINEQLLDLYSKGVISAIERNYLKTLVDAAYKNANGVTTYLQFSVTINSLCRGWNDLFADGGSGEGAGALGAIVLAITRSSKNWWLDRDYAINNVNELPQFIVVDAGGALKAAIANSLIQYISNNKRVNWKIVGAHALWGAIDASTGGLMKFGRFIRR